MIHDPALALHTVKASQQAHRDHADAHRLSRQARAAGRSPARATPSLASRLVGRVPRLRRPGVAPVTLHRPVPAP